MSCMSPKHVGTYGTVIDKYIIRKPIIMYIMIRNMTSINQACVVLQA